MTAILRSNPRGFDEFNAENEDKIAFDLACVALDKATRDLQCLTVTQEHPWLYFRHCEFSRVQWLRCQW
jgi:hypothetical protein